jgi:hypothetical protein
MSQSVATPDASHATPATPEVVAEETKPLGSVGSSAPKASSGMASSVMRVVTEARARKRIRAIVLVWAFEFVCAFLIASPIQAWASSVWGGHPDGDAVLFRPGGHALLTWLGEDSPVLPIITKTTLLSILLFAVVGQIISAAAIASLATEDEEGKPTTISRSLRVGVSQFWAFFVIGILVNALEGFLLGIGLFVSSGLDHAFASAGDARAFTVRLVVLGFFVLLVLAAGVVADLARAAIVRAGAADETTTTGQRLRDGLRLAAQTATKGRGRGLAKAMLAWGWRAAIGLILIYVGSIAGDLTGERAGGALWLLFFVHQGILFARAALRTSWLANALRLTRETELQKPKEV